MKIQKYIDFDPYRLYEKKCFYKQKPCYDYENT